MDIQIIVTNALAGLAIAVVAQWVVRRLVGNSLEWWALRIAGSVLGVITVDPKSHEITQANFRALEIFGHTKLKGTSVHTLIGPETKDKHRELVSAFINEAFSGNGARTRHMGGRRLNGIRKDGTKVELTILLVPGSVLGRRRVIALILE